MKLWTLKWVLTTLRRTSAAVWTLGMRKKTSVANSWYCWVNDKPQKTGLAISVAASSMLVNAANAFHSSIHSLVATIHSAAIKGTPVIQLLYSHRVPRRRAHSDRPASRRRSPRNTQTLQPSSSPLYSQEMYRSSFLHGSPAYWYLLYWDQTWSHYSFIALPRLKTTALENSHRYLPSTEVCYSPQSVQVCACPPDAHSTAKPRLLTTDRRGAPSPALQSHPIPQTHSP